MQTQCAKCGTARDVFVHAECPQCWGSGTAKSRARLEREARSEAQREREYRATEHRAELQFQWGAAERGRSVRGWGDD